MKFINLLKLGILSGSLSLLSCLPGFGADKSVREEIKKGVEKAPTLEQRTAGNLEILKRLALENKRKKWRSDRFGNHSIEYITTNAMGAITLKLIDGSLDSFSYQGDMYHSNTQVTILDTMKEGPGFSRKSFDYTHVYSEIAETSGRVVYDFNREITDSRLKEIQERYLCMLDELCRLESSSNAVPSLRGKVYK